MSDQGLKVDVVPLGIDLLPNVPVYEYAYAFDEETRHVGVMPEDLKKVAPSAVYEDADGHLRIDTAKYAELVKLRRFNVSAAGRAN